MTDALTAASAPNSTPASRVSTSSPVQAQSLADEIDRLERMLDLAKPAPTAGGALPECPSPPAPAAPAAVGGPGVPSPPREGGRDTRPQAAFLLWASDQEDVCSRRDPDYPVEIEPETWRWALGDAHGTAAADRIVGGLEAISLAAAA